MTLPFRRRHHDDDASHDRARALISADLDGPLSEPDAAWLAGHLERCHECIRDAEAYRADRELLRSLRAAPPPPPRDLWARTSAAIDRERRPARGLAAAAGRTFDGVLPRRQRLPLGVLSGALVVLIVVAVAFAPGARIVPSTGPVGTPIARVSIAPGATAVAITGASGITWLERTPSGGFAIVSADIDAACPPSDPACPPLPAGSATPLDLGAAPKSVAIAPNGGQVAVVGSGVDTAGTVIILTVPTPPAPPSPTTTPVLASERPTPVPSVSASVTPSLSPPASPAPASAAPSPSLSASPATAGQAIIHGVEVVGDPSYTADGTWLAFSAKPLDGSGGPYLYAWHAGDPEARQLTMAGMTYFAGWFGDWIVASEVRVDVAGPPASSRSASGAPQASGGPAGVSGWPSSFLLDPLTDARANLRVPGVWLPSIDPTGRFVTYWSGSLEPVFATDATAAEPSPALETSASGTAAAAASVPPSSGPLGSVGVPPIAGWQTGAGHLVLDGWDRPLALPSASPSGSATPELQGSPTASDGASLFPDGAFVPSFAAGPAGTQIELADGGITAFDVRFDPSGTRLATWVSDGGDSGVGRLWLTLLDRARGALRSTPDPLPAPGVESLRGFSLSSGRLGWVAPEGQDGQPSSVHVLAWTGDVFGQVQTVPGGSPQIVR